MIPSVDQVAFLVLCLVIVFSSPVYLMVCDCEEFSVRVRTRAVSAGKRGYRPADTLRTLHLMTEDDLKFGIRYLQWLLYRARLFVSHVKRSYKASEEVQAFVKAIGAQRHPSKQ